MSGFSLDLAALLQRWAATVSASYGVNPYLFGAGSRSGGAWSRT